MVHPGANDSLTLSSPHIIPSRIYDIVLTCGALSSDSFIPTDVAVTSIADMTQQALQSFDARLSRFEYADAAIPVRIVLLRSAPSAPSAMTVRSIVI
ncbi:MAG: hypothetical protein ASARMPREDX12_003203 [Alectoria sarmentosa]|nr:MAG: hypothetical protein ASARMPREDX12_003203 [Alectoria sarmentosa]